MENYEQVWRDFVSGGSLEFGGHTDPDWQGGHTLSASFIVPVDISSLKERLEPLRDALRMMPFVSLHPDHFMHVTLLPLGFLVPDPEAENEISPERLAEVEVRARKAVEDFPPFEIEFANLNAFPGAAFVEAYDGGMLKELRNRLCKGFGMKPVSGTPHLTLAYFQAPDDTPMPEGLVASIQKFRVWTVGKVPVNRIDLTLLDVRADYPEPERIARIPLREVPL